MITIIDQLPPGVIEVASHLVLVDEELRRTSYGYVEPRADELAVLVDQRVKAAMQSNGFTTKPEK